MSRRFVAVAGVLTAVMVIVERPRQAVDGTLHAAQNLTRDDAVRMEQKLNAIMARGALKGPAAKTAKPLRTSFTDREVNSYFKFAAEFPKGVVDPRLTFVDGGKLEAFATVDIQAIKNSKERGIFDPINLFALAGAVDLKVIGTFRGNGGQGTLQIESASLGGIPVPQWLLAEVIASYTKTPDNPAGFSLDKPFPLPVGIREVELIRGAATVVQ
jgi:hypothetical protein